MADLAKVLLYGDIHMSSKKYGAHNNYPKESLEYFKAITDKAKECGATHIIGTGDISYGRFDSLEFRTAVEEQLEAQYELTNGNRFEVKGNHDSATYGMTEFEYYVNKGLIKPSTNLKIGNVNISMVDYDKYKSTKILDASNPDEINVVIAHNYFRFNDTRIANYGKRTVSLDNMTDWFGVDYLFCGHIHNFIMFDGNIIKGNNAHPLVVTYLGCMSRPSYREGHMDPEGHLVLLTIKDNNEMELTYIEVPLWSLEDSFNISDIETKAEKPENKQVDISDIVQQLNSHERNIGNPEDIIQALPNVDTKYKNKAIELLKLGQA